MTVHVCKQDAKTRLKSRKLRAFRITLCIASLSVVSGFVSYFLPQVFFFGVNDRYWICLLQAVFCLVSIALLGALRQGRAAWLYCNACGKEPSYLQFLYWFRKGRGFRAARLYCMLWLRKTAWTVLLSVPGASILTGGILFADRINSEIRSITWAGGALCMAVGLVFAGMIKQKYALAPILFVRSAHKSVRSAIRGSCFLMEDDCMRMYLFKLSFLPWAIACITVLPLVYVVPYYQQAKTCMLRGILRAHTI